VAHAVEFLGFLPRAEKVRRMQQAWVVVQPSPKEGWGLTVVEAGACGTAVVAADSPGLRDSVRRDETGLLVPYGDDARLSEALVRVLTDPPLRERLAAAGIAWAARFTWPACARASLDALTGAASPG
jgi:glycosyltransferase involved in cell wall biosynthesis